MNRKPINVNGYTIRKGTDSWHNFMDLAATFSVWMFKAVVVILILAGATIMIWGR